MKTIDVAKKYEDYIISLRRHFHENPELSGKEEQTVAKISAELEAMGVEHTVIEKGGVLAVIRGEKDNGKAIMLRADIDALPVQETEDNLKPGARTCISKIPGVMHACGHDGHTAMLLGAAKILLEKKSEIEGTVYLCFERGEEATGDVKYIFAHIEKQNIHIDTVYGMHLEATTPSGKMILNDTNMMASSMIFDVTIEGDGGHGSRPDQAVNPIDAFWAIYGGLLTLRVQKIDPFKPLTYSVGKVSAGTASNIIPQTCSFAGSMRTFDSEGVGMLFHNELRHLIDTTCEAHHCKPIYNAYSKPSLAVINDPTFARFARQVIGEELGAENVFEGEPWMGSDSYSQYLAQWPGVYAFLGVNNEEKGVGAAHHNQAFDIDEDVLASGAASAAAYAIAYLKNPALKGGRKISYSALLERMGRLATVKELFGE